MHEEIQSLTVNVQSLEHFVSSVRKFMKVDRLTKTLMNELIERIEVYNPEGKGKSRSQRVVIHYRLVGDFWMSARSNYELTSDPQKGNTVLYSVNTASQA